VEVRNNTVSVLQYNTKKGFYVEGCDANRFRDPWALIHTRKMHPSLYDSKTMHPSKLGMDYLMPIFTDAMGEDDTEHLRRAIFRSRITRSTRMCTSASGICPKPVKLFRGSQAEASSRRCCAR